MNALALILGYWVMFLSGIAVLTIFSGFTLFFVTRIIGVISRHYRGRHAKTD